MAHSSMLGWSDKELAVVKQACDEDRNKLSLGKKTPSATGLMSLYKISFASTRTSHKLEQNE